MDQTLRQQIELWYEQDEHQQIVDAIHCIPRAEWDYDMISQLIRAYNNLSEYDKAYEMAMEVAEEGANDALWHYRHGYTLYFMSDDHIADARREFEIAKTLTNDQEILGYIDEMLDEVKSFEDGAQQRAVQEMEDRVFDLQSKERVEGLLMIAEYYLTHEFERFKSLESFVSNQILSHVNRTLKMIAKDGHLDDEHTKKWYELMIIQNLKGDRPDVALSYARRMREYFPDDTRADEWIEQSHQDIEAQRTRAAMIAQGGQTPDAVDVQDEYKEIFSGAALLHSKDCSIDEVMDAIDKRLHLEFDDLQVITEENNAFGSIQGVDVFIQVSATEHPFSGDQLAYYASENYTWGDANEVVATHQAYIEIKLIGSGDDSLRRGLLFVQLMAACSTIESTIGIYIHSVVYEPQKYLETAMTAIANEDYPTYNLVWIHLRRIEEGKLMAFTKGLLELGVLEMEIVNLPDKLDEIIPYCYQLCTYALLSDDTLVSYDTFANAQESPDTKHIVTLRQSMQHFDIPVLQLDYNRASNEEVEYRSIQPPYDSGAWHLPKLRTGVINLDERSAFAHMSLYLSWAIIHGMMSEDFVAKYPDIIQQVIDNPIEADLRSFVYDELIEANITSDLFNEEGQAFGAYYCDYRYSDYPHFHSDIDDYALAYFGPERYDTEEFHDEEYLYIPFDEEYHANIYALLDRRYANWKKDRVMEPMEMTPKVVELSRLINSRLVYFAPNHQSDRITSYYSYSSRLDRSVQMLIVDASEEMTRALWDALSICANSPLSDTMDDEDIANGVYEVRSGLVTSELPNAQEIFFDHIHSLGFDWQAIQHEWMKHDHQQAIPYPPATRRVPERIPTIWDEDTQTTRPTLVCTLPISEPWMILALPFYAGPVGPTPLELISIAKYWYEKYGAVPYAIRAREIVFRVPDPLNAEEACRVALEQAAILHEGAEGLRERIVRLSRSTLWHLSWV